MPGSGDAQPNWDRFAADHNRSFEQLGNPDLAAAIAYFRASPPRKQTRTDGNLGWSEPQRYDGNGPLLTWLLLCIRTIRNNLFHGGKFPRFPVHDPSRDRELIEHSLAILSSSLSLDTAVEHTFLEGIEL